MLFIAQKEENSAEWHFIFRKKSFDVKFSLGYLSWLYDAVENVKLLMKPDGKLVKMVHFRYFLTNLNVKSLSQIN